METECSVISPEFFDRVYGRRQTLCVGVQAIVPQRI